MEGHLHFHFMGSFVQMNYSTFSLALFMLRVRGVITFEFEPLISSASSSSQLFRLDT